MLWISQIQKDKHCIIPLPGGTQSGHIYRDKKKKGCCQGPGEGNGELSGGLVSISEEEKTLDMDDGTG